MAAPSRVRRFLSSASVWVAGLGAGTAVGLAAAQLAGPVGAPWTGPAATSQTAAGPDLWFDGGEPRREARELLALLRGAADHGLDPADYRAGDIEGALAGPAVADPEVTGRLLTEALAAYARDLRVPRDLSDVTYIDEELRPAAPGAERLAADGSPVQRLRTLHEKNPLYEELRTGLARYRRDWSALPQVPVPAGPALAAGSRGPRVTRLRERLAVPAKAGSQATFDAALGKAVESFRRAHGMSAAPVADSATIAALNRGAAHYEGIIIANLDRLRALPLDGDPYVLVDTAEARLRMIEGGQEVDSMRVIVGKPGMATPLLAGYISFAVINPYWNVPPDLVRKTVAPAVIREGPDVLRRRNFVLSADWRSTDRIDPARVDWQAVAAGRESVWVRQLPGGRNMMGDIKFMLPNDMGIYLHDTPDKALFARSDRRLSSGCVRVEDARRLAAWLFRRPVLGSDTAPDKRIDLPRPVPVFITYLTASAPAGQVRFRPDVEQRQSKPLAARDPAAT